MGRKYKERCVRNCEKAQREKWKKRLLKSNPESQKVKQDLLIKKEEVKRKGREEERHDQLQEQFILAQQQQQMLNMMQQQNRAIIELMGKFTSPK